MQYSKEIFEQFDKVYIVGYVLRELEKNKHSLNEEKKYLSRRAVRDIEDNKNKVVFYVSENKYNLPNDFDEDIVDNKIISNMKDLFDKDNEIFAISNDILFRFTCECIGLRCEKFGSENKDDKKYSGIQEISLTLPEYNNWFMEIDKNPLNLCVNEYLIINETTKNEKLLFMWNGAYFEEIEKVKPIINKYMDAKDKITPLDIYQKALIHMLQNEKIKIKITNSIYGSGKTFLMFHWALQQLEKGDKYSKLYFVKSDSPPRGRKDFPAIPGGVLEKVSPLLSVICDMTSEDDVNDILSRNEKLEILPIQFVRGRSLRKGSILYINEAQNFTPSEMELLISRIGEDSFVLLDGSTKQIDNRNCSYRNGLTVASNNFRDKSNSAQVNMIVDYRSDLSKMVSEMDWHD